MTAPIDIPMPYACTTIPQGGATVLQIAEGHRNRIGTGASTIFEVPDGMSLVSVTWDGPQAVTFGVRDNITGVRKDIGAIPAGTGARMTTVPVSVVGTGHGIQVFLDRIPTTAEAAHRGSISVVSYPIFASGGGVVSAAFWGLLTAWLRGGRNDHTGHVRHDVGDYAPRSHGVSIPTGAENTGLNRHSALDPCGNPAPFRYDYGDDRLVGIIRPANSSEERRHQLPHEECGSSYLRHPENAVVASTHRIHRAHLRYHRHQPYPGGPGQSPLRSSDHSRVLAFSGGAE